MLWIFNIFFSQGCRFQMEFISDISFRIWIRSLEKFDIPTGVSLPNMQTLKTSSFGDGHKEHLSI